jgi:hypothetical protein
MWKFFPFLFIKTLEMDPDLDLYPHPDTDPH